MVRTRTMFKVLTLVVSAAALVACGSSAEVAPEAVLAPPTAIDSTPVPVPEPIPTPSPTPATHELKGTIKVIAQTSMRMGDGTPVQAGDCFVTSHEDVVRGAAVVVTDGAGAIIGSTTLTSSDLVDTRMEPSRDTSEWDVFTQDYEDLPETTIEVGYCQASFALTVPDTDFYAIEVAARGKVVFSKADLETAGWAASLSVA